MAHSEEKHLVIRVDAGTQIGTGHLMRCLALAQAWKDTEGKVVFITACQSKELLQQLRDEEFDIHLVASPHPHPDDWEHAKDILATHPNAWAVLDGYHFDEVYQQQVKELGHRLLVIDDMAHLKHYYADIVLNQNLHAEQMQYFCEPYTRLLLGTRYVLLRREFLAWKDWKREIPEVARRVLVTLGGSDPENHTLKVIKALQRVEVDGLEATVVIGANNPHADALQTAIRRSRIPIRLIHNAKNMPELMDWADVAISSAGTTCWELAWMGVPTAFLILADNQTDVAEGLHRVGAAASLGQAHRIEMPELVERLVAFLGDNVGLAMMAQRAKALVDGEGVSRLLMQLKGEKLRLRRVREQDCRLLWEWSNDPSVRIVSFSSESIPWDEHVTWFKTQLCNPCCHYYILLDDGDLPIGQVRFDIEGNQAEISIGIGSRFRGQGYGAEAIRLASEHLFCETTVTRIYAQIKENNIPSIRAFVKASYKEIGATVVKGQQALQMVLNKNDALSKDNSYQDQ